MGPRLERVVAWLEALHHFDPAPRCPHLSAQGARAAWEAALASLTPEALTRAVTRPGEPYDRAVMVVARTVFTAPLEWAAVLLARGTELTLKPSSADAGFAEELVQMAQAQGLPLFATSDRDIVGQLPLVVVMGTDETVDQVRAAAAPDARVLGFGHRFGAAYLTTAEGFAAIGPDLALHDGLGCMSPAMVFTDWPEDEATAALAQSWRAIDAQWPSGPIDPIAGAQIRQREALARVLGQVSKDRGWSVHALPRDRFAPGALPRSVVVHAMSHREHVETVFRDHEKQLSTVGTDDPHLSVPDSARVCRPGEMQRPPLVRFHDGVDWLGATLR
ncbi:MAG: acyl-CoA reductase [Myxococcota bacterium]